MVAVLLTGMSGACRSTALAGLAEHGRETVDTDDPGWIEVVNGEALRRQDRVLELLDRPRDVPLAGSAEVDRYWDALAERGTPVACGWITDRFGLSWQIVPKRLPEPLGDSDPARAKRALDAMPSMVELDVVALEAAADG